MTINLYEFRDVWERLNQHQAYRFTCLHNLESDKYIVLKCVLYQIQQVGLVSRDEPFQRHLEIETYDTIDAFFDMEPEMRLEDDEPAGGYDSLKEAIYGYLERHAV